MKEVPQGLRDLFSEMVEENKHEIKEKMKETLLKTISNVPAYIADIIEAFSIADAEDDD
jgi:hypothetical protein